MKKTKRIFALLLCTLMLLGVMGNTALAAKKVSLNKTSLTLYVGKSATLKLNGSAIKSAKSNNSKVAAVNNKGKVTAKKKGTATITVTGKNKKNYKCKVTVKEKAKEPKTCPYLLAWVHNDTELSDIIQVDFKCTKEAVHSYYAVHSWFDEMGYAGFQIMEDGSHILIMSIWDNGDLKPTIEYAPYSRDADKFDGEGTGNHVLSDYDWTANKWYTMRIQAVTSGDKTIYEQWIRPEDGSWEKICAISYPQAGRGFTNNAPFLEDFYPFSNERRSMELRNMSSRNAETGEWSTKLSYYIENYADNTLQKENVNYDCKAEAKNDSTLYMEIGGRGYEKVTEMPKYVYLKKGEIVEPYLFELES